MLNLLRDPLPSLGARHSHQHARPYGNVLGREVMRERDARAGCEDEGVRFDFAEHAGEDSSVSHG